MLSWLPVAPEATNVIGVPLTVMVSPAAKFVASESVVAAPDSSVAPVMGAGVAALLLTTLPAIVADGLKKLSDAVIAEAATSDVSLSVFIDAVSEDCKFSVVAAVSTPIANEPAGGTPAGCVMVAPVSDELTEDNFRPNAEPSSATLVTVVVADGDVTASRPIPPVP